MEIHQSYRQIRLDLCKYLTSFFSADILITANFVNKDFRKSCGEFVKHEGIDLSSLNCTGQNIFIKIYPESYKVYINNPDLENSSSISLLQKPKNICVKISELLTSSKVKNLHCLVNIQELTIWNTNFKTKYGQEISKLENLEYLNLSENGLTDEFLISLQYMKNLKVLNLNRNKISDICFEYISGLKNLEILKISRLEHWEVINKVSIDFRKRINGIDSYLRPFLSNLSKDLKLLNLKTLDISGNIINKRTFQNFSVFSSLTDLTMCGCRIKEDYYFESIPNLEKLDVSRNELGTNFCMNLSKLKKLTCLKICRNDVSYESCKYLAELKGLIELDLSENDVGEEGCFFLRNLNNLQKLDISKNNIGNKSCMYIAFLAQLNELTIQLNSITDKGCEELCKLTCLKYLDLNGNEITSSGCKYLSKLKNLENLNLRGNAINVEGIYHFTNMNRLKGIDLSWNDIIVNSNDILCRIKSLNRNDSMTYID